MEHIDQIYMYFISCICILYVAVASKTYNAQSDTQIIGR